MNIKNRKKENLEIATMKKKNILTAVLGNVFEAYDITCFLFLAPFIAQNFFSHADNKDNLFKTLGVFFVGFLMRPLGGLVLGLVADVYGRKKSLVLSVLLASLSTSLILLIPGYAVWGDVSTFLLVLCRLGQSFALGGEYVIAVAFLVEHAAAHRRGYAGSWAAVGANAGVFIASVVGAAVSYGISHAILPVWAWRLPFLFSLIGILVSYWMRKNALETLGFVLESAAIQKHTPSALWQSMKSFISQDKLSLFIIFGLTWLGASSYYIIFTYAPLHQGFSHTLSNAQALLMTTCSILLLVVLAPLVGALSDKIGRDVVLFFSSIGFLLLAYPYFYFLSFGTGLSMGLMQMIMAIPAAGIYSVILTAIVDLIPITVRCALGGVLYSVASGLFGGTAPLIADRLVQLTGHAVAPAYYLMFCAVVGVVAAFYFGNRNAARLVEVYEC